MKLQLFLKFIFLSVITFSQVGVNTDNPQATLDVVGTVDNSTLDGIIAPRFTGDELALKPYTTAQTGALVYVTEPATNLTGQVVNAANPGYYYFDGSVWQIFLNTDTGDPSSDSWVDDNTNSQVKLGTLSDGTTSRPIGTEFVALDNGNVGIGTASPSYNLEINAGTSGESGLKFTQLKDDINPAFGKDLAVDNTGKVIPVDRVGTVFVGRVLPGGTVDIGWVFLPLEPIYDPEGRYNATTNIWVPHSADNSIYEVSISLARIDGTMPFTMHRPNSATLKPLPTETGQNFQYSYTGIMTKNSRLPQLGGIEGIGIRLYNTVASYTFLSSYNYVSRGYWTITIKRIAKP